MQTSSDSLKIKKGLKLVSRSSFSHNDLIKGFILLYYINCPNFTTRLSLLPNLFSKMYFVFHAQAFDNVMIFEYLKSQNLIFFQELKQLSKRNKKKQNLLLKCSFRHKKQISKNVAQATFNKQL